MTPATESWSETSFWRNNGAHGGEWPPPWLAVALAAAMARSGKLVPFVVSRVNELDDAALSSKSESSLEISRHSREMDGGWGQVASGLDASRSLDPRE